MLQAEQDALVLMAQKGNEQALELLYGHLNPGLLRFAYKLSGDRQQALDVVQDVWLKTVSDLRKLRDPRAFKSWLYRAVKWQCLDQFRRRSTREQAVTELTQLSEHNRQETSEEGDELALMINALPELEREAVFLFYQEQLTLDEIALVQESPLGTVKSRLNRARNRLKQQWEKDNELG